MRRRRNKRPPRLSGPGPALATWRRTVADLFDRLAKVWARELLSGWDDRQIASTGGRIRSDARTHRSVREAVAKVRLETVDAIDDSGIGEAADAVAGRVDKFVAAEQKKLFGIPTSALLADRQIEQFREVNLAKIKSLAGEQVEDLGLLLEDAEIRGLRVEEVRARILERFDVSKSKADLLARDQILKLNGQIVKERQQAAGITEYTWSTSGDERVREDHAALDGQRFTWGDPPIVDERTGRREEPGGDYQCRCAAIPVVTWLDDDG